MSKIIIAAGPVIVEDDRVLLSKHGDDDFWKFPGGRVEDFESNIKNTVVREAKEELGINLEIANNEPYFFYSEKETGGVMVSIILIHFLAKRLDGVVPGADIREWTWLRISDLDKENLAPNIKPVLSYFKLIK